MFPSQKKALLSSIVGTDPTYSNLISFSQENNVHHFPPQLASLIQVFVMHIRPFIKLLLMNVPPPILCPSLAGNPLDLLLSTNPIILWKFLLVDVSSCMVFSMPYKFLWKKKLLIWRSKWLVHLSITTSCLATVLKVQWFVQSLVYLSCFTFPIKEILSWSTRYNYFLVILRLEISLNSTIAYESVGMGLFKDSQLMEIFSLPPPSNTASVNLIMSHHDPFIIPNNDHIYCTHVAIGQLIISYTFSRSILNPYLEMT